MHKINDFELVFHLKYCTEIRVMFHYNIIVLGRSLSR